jgi:hypothetical protein
MPPPLPSPAPTLLECWLEIVRPWTVVFMQQRTFLRAVRQGLGSLLCLGRSTLSRIIWTTGREQNSWSGEYFLHSRAQWDPHALFAPMVREALHYCPGRLVAVAVDDTRLKKTGRSIPQAQYHRDPLSPPFHVNLIWALRFLQASVLLPLHRSGPWSARGIPIRFEEVSSVKKPGRRAGEEAWQAYKQEVKQRNLSRRFVQSMAELRATFDHAGAQKKVLVIVGDGSFCNRTVLAGIPDRTVLIARTRKDASLCFRAPKGDRRFYSQDKFTPDQVRLDANIAWQTTKIFYGGKRRKVRYKEVTDVLWQGGARKRPLRLLVIAATPYGKTKKCKTLLPPSRLPADNHAERLDPATAADVLRPLADRSEPQRRERHARRRTSPDVESRFRAQTTRAGRGFLFGTAAGRIESFWPRQSSSLRRPSQMALPRQTPLLPRSCRPPS